MKKAQNSLDRLKSLGFSQRQIADALGLTEEHVSRIKSGAKSVPVYVDAVFELLEALPPKDWPDRWRK
jgi:transcriptional regulator with XRE-family HTH domain